MDIRACDISCYRSPFHRLFIERNRSGWLSFYLFIIPRHNQKLCFVFVCIMHSEHPKEGIKTLRYNPITFFILMKKAYIFVHNGLFVYSLYYLPLYYPPWSSDSFYIPYSPYSIPFFQKSERYSLKEYGIILGFFIEWLYEYVQCPIPYMELGICKLVKNFWRSIVEKGCSLFNYLTHFRFICHKNP